jgi:serine/threonine protein kinase
LSRIPSSDVPPPDLPGYRFIRHIGAGGNAQVYLYEQQLPKREVAVKVLNESALSESARSRFTAEANVTAGLQHRHIVQVFDAKVTKDGRPYIVMPYYPQPNLSVRARRSHFSIADVLRVGIQIGSAVETSHRRGVLHRDIKPQNILTDSYGEPALTDFGIATTTGGDGPEGLSVPWSPPEILLGTAPGDKRSDVYSLGATLWHLLVGRSPFEVPGGDNGHYALTNRIKTGALPRTQRADVPDSLERLLRRTMAKDPVARPQTAMELIRGLQSIEQEMRLPLTQPILPADGPGPGDAAGGDTISRPSAHSGETTFRRGFGQGPGQPGQPGQAAWGSTSRPGQDNDTRRRDPVRIDPRGSAAAAEEQATRARGPVRLDPWESAPAPASARARHFPPEVPEDATLARSRRVAPGGADHFGATKAGFPGRAGGDLGRAGPAVPSGAADPDQRRSGRGRVLALVGGGAALAVAAGVAVLTLSPGGGQPGSPPATASAAPQPNSGQNAIGDPTVPGTPVLSATRLSATKVKFTWTYDNPVSTDTFEWTRESGTAGNRWGETSKAELIVAVPSGQTVCYEVRVDRADATASDESPPDCSPQ